MIFGSIGPKEARGDAWIRSAAKLFAAVVTIPSFRILPNANLVANQPASPRRGRGLRNAVYIFRSQGVGSSVNGIPAVDSIVAEGDGSFAITLSGFRNRVELLGDMDLVRGGVPDMLECVPQYAYNFF